MLNKTKKTDSLKLIEINIGLIYAVSKAKLFSTILFFHKILPCLGLHGGVVVSTVTSQQRVPGSIPTWGLSVWSLHVLPVYAWVLSGYSGFLPPSKNMHVRLIGDSKLSLGVSVNVCVAVCLVCLCVAL